MHFKKMSKEDWEISRLQQKSRNVGLTKKDKARYVMLMANDVSRMATKNMEKLFKLE